MKPRGTGTFWEEGKLVERSDDDDPDFEAMVTASIEKRAKQDRLDLESRAEKLLRHYPPPLPPPAKKGRPTDYVAMGILIFHVWMLHKNTVGSKDEFIEILKAELRDPYKLSLVLKETFRRAYRKEAARNRVRKLRKLLGMEQ